MRRRIFAAAACLALLLSCAGCGSVPEAKTTVYAMDTVMTLTAYGDGAVDALKVGEAELHRLDDLLCRHEKESALSLLNREGYLVNGEIAGILARAKDLSALTDGAFDPTLAPVLEAWGFGTENPRVPGEAELRELLSRTGAERIALDGDEITLEEGTEIDLGGIAKGWAGDDLKKLFAAAGVSGATIDLGGDVCVMGKKPDGNPWRIALKDPADSENYLGILSATDTFIVTSGVYERFFEEGGVHYHHILDPETGASARSGLVSATVVCSDGAAADALSTALFVLGEERALSLYKEESGLFEMILVTEDGRVLYTPGLAGSFEPNGESEYTYEELS